MIKKQVGFQIASYLYPEDYWPQGGGTAKYGRMRSEVESLQSNGWEVIDSAIVMSVQGEGTQSNFNVVLTLVKYEWIVEPAPTTVTPAVEEEKPYTSKKYSKK